MSCEIITVNTVNSGSDEELFCVDIIAVYLWQIIYHFNLDIIPACVVCQHCLPHLVTGEAGDPVDS